MPPESDNSQLTAQIEGFRSKRFECVGGFGARIDVLTFKDGPDAVVRQRAGRTKYDPVTLRLTQSGAPALWKWWKTAGEGADGRRKVTMILTDARGQALAKWVLLGCWPRDWWITPIETTDSKAAYAEHVTLVVEDIDLVS
jgi:phage tail-like protein